MNEFAPAPQGEPGDGHHQARRPCGGFDALTRYRLHALGLDPERLQWLPMRERADALYRHFVDHVPFENLSGNRSCAEHPDDPSAWPRATDRLLRDHKERGLGGSSFSSAYALRDLLSGIGVNAHCTVGRNLVTEEAHAAVVAYIDGDPLLYDPALLTHGPLPIRPGGRLDDPLGSVSLAPRRGATLTVLLHLRCAGTSRPLYALVPAPIPPPRFRQAWVASFYRGRRQPLRMACRVGNEIRRYSERPCRLEILTEHGREARQLGRSPVTELHESFGIDPECLRAWFARAD